MQKLKQPECVCVCVCVCAIESERARGRENELGKGRGVSLCEAGERKRFVKDFLLQQREAERKMRTRVQERETVIMFSGSPLVQRLMDGVKR